MQILVYVLIAIAVSAMTSAIWAVILYNLHEKDDALRELKSAISEIEKLKADNARMLQMINEHQIVSTKNWRSK